MVFDAPLIGEGLVAAGVLMVRSAPIGHLWFPFSHQLTVLYGRNGSGKTLLLSEMSSALRGVNTDGVTALVLDVSYHYGGFNSALFIRLLNQLRPGFRS